MVDIEFLKKNVTNYEACIDEFAQSIIELIQWRDNTKLRKKAMAIQRVIDRKIMWAHEHGLKQSLYMYCVGNGYDLYGKN